MELWFKHGSGWHENQKLVDLIVETGYEGYGVYAVLLELLVSQGGSLELNYKKLNHTVRCSTELLKRVITEFDLFDVVANSDGSVCFYAEWLLEDIRRAKKTSKARSECGKKGQRIRHGVEKTSELANTVGVPEIECPSKMGENQANAQAIASTKASTHARIREDKIIDRRSSSKNARENFSESFDEDADSSRKPLMEHIPALKEDVEWHKQLATSMVNNGVKAGEKEILTLLEHFCQEKCARGEHLNLKTQTDAKRWFYNWMMFKIKMLKEDERNKSNTQANGGCRVPATTTYTSYPTGYRKSFAEQVRESKEKLMRDTARMLQNGELGSLGIGGGGLPRDLQP